MARQQHLPGLSRPPIFAGDRLKLEFEVVDVETLAGAVVLWAMYDQAGEEVLRRETPQIVVDANVFIVELESADTRELPGQYHHEGMVVDGSGNENTVVYGTFELRERRLSKGE